MTEKPLFSAFLALVFLVALIGFVWGTDTRDNQIQNGLIDLPDCQDKEGAPCAPMYIDEQRHNDRDPNLKVADECIDCHEDRGSRRPANQRQEHPTLIPAPQGANLAKLVAAGGRLEKDVRGQERILVCRSCHRPHNSLVDPRLIIPAAGGELCLTCHTDHSPAQSQHPVTGPIPANLYAQVAALGGPTTGGLSCLTCHSPHKARAGDLLRTPGTGVTACRTCHTDKAAALGARGHGGQTCLDCHGMHQAPTYLGQGPKAGDPSDQPCVSCHAGSVGKAPQISLTAGHPMWKNLLSAMRNGQGGTVGCNDCHTPHSDQPKLLTRHTVSATCLDCHADKSTVTGTPHDASVVPVIGKKDVCISCHDVHGKTSRPSKPAGVNPASQLCLSCHDGRTDAKKIPAWKHPKGLLFTVAGLPFRYTGSIPYFGPDGKRTTAREAGEITCQTCHDPHRWHHDTDEKPGVVEGSEQNSFLRDPQQVTAFCSVCHGNDALPRFRFFHANTFRKADVPEPADDVDKTEQQKAP